MREGTRTSDGETRHERALGLLIERLEELRHRKAHGRIEIHIRDGRIDLLRTVEDELVS